MEERLRQLIGRNLKAAREAMGISQEDFAKKLGLSRATLSAIENGHSTLDSTKLIQASQTLGRPVSDFLLEEQEDMAFLYRAAERVVPDDGVRSKFRHFCESYRQIEEIVGVADNLLPPPGYTFIPHLQTKPNQFAVQVAESERERLGVGNLEPLPNIFKLLEANGVRIFVMKIPNPVLFGLSAFSKRYGPCVLVNAESTIERQIFTLAHEYGHLVMHRDRYRNLAPSEERDTDFEEMAHTFAGRFLVPAAGLREFVLKTIGKRRISLEDAVSCKHYFRTSLKVIAHRLLHCELISQADRKMLIDKADEYKKQEFAPLDAGKYLDDWQGVKRFDTLLRKAALSELISTSRLAELLGANLIETRSKVQDWRKEMTALAST
ncbi:MAG TPA: XRE family transcriptional regulator [Candidatus Angelobacter sp.]|nr:XRE family transcriptional regulator [Candidatus Angelobacter sp.]